MEASRTIQPDRSLPQLAIVSPCFNEQETLEESCRILAGKIESLAETGMVASNSFLLLVDDGSTDSTWECIEHIALSAELGRVSAIKLAHNRGHQNALYAGLMEALELGADCTISLDIDLQDDIDAIDAMLNAYREGAEVVVGVRADRSSDGFFKRHSAQLFYKLAATMGMETTYNAADFRLMGCQALQALSEYSESNLYLRGIIPSIGFPTAEVHYQRKPRLAGTSKYPFRKMASLALNGITSFSIAPIRMVTGLGLAALVVALVMIVRSLVNVAIGNTVPGWTSLMVSLWFIGGLVMVSLGIIGEYVGRAFIEAKKRPRYTIEQRLPAHQKQ